MKYGLGVSVVAVVSTVIISSASSIVYAISTEAHSSPVLLASTWQQYESQHQNNSPANDTLVASHLDQIDLSPLETGETPVVLGASIRNCSEVPEDPPPKNMGSVVNYLRTTNQPYRFEDRQQLAQEFGLTEYSGTAQENVTLLKLVKERQQNAWEECHQ